MTLDLLVNLAATAIAFVFGFFSRSTYQWLQRMRATRRIGAVREQRHPRFTSQWLVDYYQKRGRLADLFSFCHGDRLYIVPFLTKESWRLDLVAVDELLDQTVPQRKSAAVVNRRFLSSRREYLPVANRDGEVWNDLIVCARSVWDTDSGPKVSVELAEYFQFLSACGPLEDETYAAVRKPGRATPIRDRVLGGLTDAAHCKLGAHAFGMQVATVFRCADRFDVLIQRRSHDVSIYGGALAVVPVFGCQTVDLSERSQVSVFHNYIREVYEELYGGIEVERRSAHVDPCWFYHVPAISRYISAREDGALDFRILGFGFDALNGEMDVLALAYVRDQSFAENEIRQMSANWEIQDVRVVGLYSSELTEWLVSGEFSPGSVYTLVRARNVLQPERESPRG